MAHADTETRLDRGKRRQKDLHGQRAERGGRRQQTDNQWSEPFLHDIPPKNRLA